jgi:hypothetical protein
MDDLYMMGYIQVSEHQCCQGRGAVSEQYPIHFEVSSLI